jgi:hypothetical protein
MDQYLFTNRSVHLFTSWFWTRTLLVVITLTACTPAPTPDVTPQITLPVTPSVASPALPLSPSPLPPTLTSTSTPARPLIINYIQMIDRTTGWAVIVTCDDADCRLDE